MSVWYQATPNGLFGTWITNRSNSEFLGRPATCTTIVSFSSWVTIATVPRACGRQDEIPADGTSWKAEEWSGAWAPSGQPRWR